MNILKVLSRSILIIMVFLPGYAFALPAFPGAQGFGANSVGGRGGEVIRVINLNDSGPGSFRAAVEASGPRTVVFAVSGYIDLDDMLKIKNPYLTIAGQTSPGGIAITGYPVRLLTHDVIITHMRFRRGSHKGDPEKEGESLFIGDGYNIIIDHSSLSWGTDETVQVGSYYGDIHGVTISWSMIYEGLTDPHPENDHGMGLLISDKFYDSNPPEVTVHHSFLAHHDARVPQLKGSVLIDYSNNVAYDWYHQSGSALLKGKVEEDNLPRLNSVSNFWKNGPNGNDNGCAGFFSSNGVQAGGTVPEIAKNSVYVSDNRGCGRPTGSEDEWQITKRWGSDLISSDYQRGTPWNMNTEAQEAGIPVITTTMTEEYALEMLNFVGATAPARDSADARVIQEYTDGVGDLMNDVTYPDDFPILPSLSVPTDSDSDGMADSWESSRGLLVGVNDAAEDDDSNGYTNIEEYIHHLAALAELPKPHSPEFIIVE